MSTLGHRLAFGWGFFFAIFSSLVALQDNGFECNPKVIVTVLILTFAFTIGAWFVCSKEKRELDSK